MAKRQRSPELSGNAVKAGNQELGSLSQKPKNPIGPQLCIACGSRFMTKLSMVSLSGEDVVFVSCHDCEKAIWVSVETNKEIPRKAVFGESSEE